MRARILALATSAALLVVACILVASPPSRGDTPTLDVTRSASECWSGGRTLHRVVIFNHADHGARYMVRFQRSTGTRPVERIDRVPAGQGVAEPVRLRVGVRLLFLEVYDADGILRFYASDVRALARCSR